MSRSPAYPGDFPDPFVLNANGTYLAYATNAGPINVQLMSSSDLATWQYLGDTLPTLPGWAQAGNTWAPSVLVRAGSVVLYYTLREPRSGRQAISIATAPQPQGPFIDTSSGPLIFQLEQGGSIDPSPFVDDDGTAYLLWKADANALDRPSSLWVQQLADDGLSLVGRPTKLLDHDAPWENPLIEAPALVRSNGVYYLFYSANDWASADYGIGYATAVAVLGPYTKATASGPWLASDADMAGPGGQEFFSDSGGSLYMAYHGWQTDSVGYPGGARMLHIEALAFDHGTPVLDSSPSPQ
jgi:beta-xylosidase